MWLVSSIVQSAHAEVVTLPSVNFASPIDYPKTELKAGRGASVLLQLTIDSDGQVLGAEVIESAGENFDAAAIRTIERYQFNPALDENDQPILVQIQYRLVFNPEIIPPVNIRGRVLEAGYRDPLANAQILATNSEGQQVIVTTGMDGRFELAGLSDGTWVVDVYKGGLESAQSVVTVEEGAIQELDFRLVRDQAETAMEEADASIVVEAERETSEVSVKTLSADQIQFLPGSNGDVVKAIQNLPGIARAPSGIGQLIIRGTAPEDSAFYVDGSPAPEVFHFGGLTTVLSTSNIESVQFLPGNYSVRYGRQLGGLVDIQTPSTFPDRAESFTSVDLYQSAFFVEQIVDDKYAISVSGRRSYADILAAPILNSLGATFRLPRYYDFQTQLTMKMPFGGVMQTIFFLSDDQFAFTQPGEEEEDENTVNAAFGVNFKQFQLKYTQPIYTGWKSVFTLGAGPQRRDFIFDANGEAFEENTQVNIRQEFSKDLDGEVGNAWKVGLDLRSGVFGFNYDLPSFPYEPESAEITYVDPAGYLEYRRRGQYADLITGLRVDQYRLEDANTQTVVDPRIQSRFFLTDNLKFIASTGLTSQAPLPRERSDKNDGDPDLRPERSWQNSFGLQQELLGGALRWQVLGYYNELFDLVVGREDRFQFFTGPPPVGPFDTEDYANDGTGLICGSEVEVRYTDPLRIGLLAMSFSHSERTDRNGDTRLFLYDQPVVINALYTQILPKNWRLGGRIRFGSGNPYTPVSNRIYDMSSREFIPVYGERDSGRLDPFFSLDLRVDKEYTFRNWKLGTYLDVQNATNYKNVEIQSWSYDYSEETPIQGQPTFPIFGFKGEW
jgi:TonB family protein